MLYCSSIFNPYFKTFALSSIPLHFKLVFPNNDANINLFCSLDLLIKAISNKSKLSCFSTNIEIILLIHAHFSNLLFEIYPTLSNLLLEISLLLQVVHKRLKNDIL